MGTYLTDKAVKWSLEQLQWLPKNQTALLYFLIFARSPRVDRTDPSVGQEFEAELNRYFGGPIKGGGVACYDPFAAEWRAEQYLNSTVYGRLLVGSHKWTEGVEAFFSRDPASGGWPAVFNLTDKGFNNLESRIRPPCLRFGYKLPLKSLSIYYFRFIDLSSFGPSCLEEIVEQYEKLVISKHPRLQELFKEGPSFFGPLFTSNPLSENEKISCYPLAPFASDTKTRQLLYVEDVELIKSRMEHGQTIADYIHNKLIGGKS